MDSRGKLLISGFITILIGVVLIQPLADDINSVTESSLGRTNETVTLSNVLGTISNESVTLTDVGDGLVYSGVIANDNISTILTIRNLTLGATFRDLGGFCNVTTGTGAIICNATNSTAALLNYTFVSEKTGELSQDEDIISVTELRNENSSVMTGFCNISLSTGALDCNNTHSNVCYADYSYTPDGYVQSAASVSLLNITLMFFALAVMLIGAGMVFISIKNML